MSDYHLLIAEDDPNLGWSWADPVFAIGVAIYIFYSAYQIGHEAFQQLMDRELPDEILKKIEETALAPPEVTGIHELRTRQAGQTSFVQLHLELEEQMSLKQAHAIADEVEAEIMSFLPDSEVIIHQDPVDDSGKPY